MPGGSLVLMEEKKHWLVSPLVGTLPFLFFFHCTTFYILHLCISSHAHVFCHIQLLPITSWCNQVRSMRPSSRWCRRRSTWARLWWSFSRRTVKLPMRTFSTRLRWEPGLMTSKVTCGLFVYVNLSLPSDDSASRGTELQLLHWRHAAAPCPVCCGAGGELRRSRWLGWTADNRHPMHERPDQACRSHPGKEVWPRAALWNRSSGFYYFCLFCFVLSFSAPHPLFSQMSNTPLTFPNAACCCTGR